MPGSAFVRRLLGAFRRGGTLPPPMVNAGRDEASAAAADATARRQAPLHPFVAAGRGAASEPIVVAPPHTPTSSADEAVCDPDTVDVALPPTPAVVEFINETRQLPIFSTTAIQLMQSVGDETVSPERIARMISADAGLVAQLLRIVNSPYYGLPQRCSTMSTAIAVLGLDQVRRTVLAAVTQRPLLAYLHDTRVVQSFWRHQLLCAGLARHLATQAGLDGEMAYTAGLMHEVGRLAIVIRHPHLTDRLLDVDDDDDHLTMRDERARFGFDHAEVGGALLARWGLPPAIARATAEHERTTQPRDPLSAAVWRANLLAHEWVREEDEGAEQRSNDDIDAASPQPPWMETIALTAGQRQRIVDEIATLEGASP